MDAFYGSKPTRLRDIAKLLGPIVVIGGAGVYPTWFMYGRSGGLAMLAAGCIVLPVLLVSIAAEWAILARNVRNGMWFVLAISFVRALMISILAVCVVSGFDIPPGVTLAWVLLLYLASLAGHVSWLVSWCAASATESGNTYWD